MTRAMATLLCGALGLSAWAGAARAEDEAQWGEEVEGAKGKAKGEDEEAKALEFIKENNPEMHQGLSHARRENPEAFRHKMREILPMYRDPEVRKMFVQNMRSEFQVRRLAEAARRAEGKEKEGLKKDLEKALSEQFDAKLAANEMRIGKMQEEIARLKKKIEKRRALKEQLVRKRLNEIAGDVESWDW